MKSIRNARRTFRTKIVGTLIVGLEFIGAGSIPAPGNAAPNVKKGCFGLKICDLIALPGREGCRPIHQNASLCYTIKGGAAAGVGTNSYTIWIFAHDGNSYGATGVFLVMWKAGTGAQLIAYCDPSTHRYRLAYWVGSSDYHYKNTGIRC